VDLSLGHLEDAVEVSRVEVLQDRSDRGMEDAGYPRSGLGSERH